ncbi:MAG: M48 family metalloprotease [Candidatus Freyarchaeota archaeon]|nr:M48 family metalloprotease [Candidatus Jordarchaeia archaeon]
MGRLFYLKVRMVVATAAMFLLTFAFFLGVSMIVKGLPINITSFLPGAEESGTSTFISSLGVGASIPVFPLQEAGNFFQIPESYWRDTFLLSWMLQELQWSWLFDPYVMGGLAALTVFFMFFEWLAGPSIAFRALGAKYVSPEDAPWLHSTIEELAKKSGIPKPRVAISRYSFPNGCVFGRTLGSSTLVVTEGLLKELNADEVRAVIGHELGHLKHKDCIVLTLLSAIPTLCFIIFTLAFSGLRVTYRPRGKGSGWAIVLLVIGVISILAYFVTLLVVRYLSRMREFYADAYSAYTTNPSYMKSALAKIAYGLSTKQVEVHGARAFFVEDPAAASKEINEIMRNLEEHDLNKDGVLDERELQIAMEKEAAKSRWNRLNMLFSTHPPTFKRILLLSIIEKELRAGRFSSQNIYRHI